MQELLGFTAMQSGLALMPRTLVMMVVTPVVGRLYNRVSPRVVIAFGILCTVLGAWQQGHFTLQTTASGVIGTLLVQGVGFACLFVPLTTAALSNVPRQRLTDATGLNSLLRQIGASAGLAVFATLLARNATVARHAVVSHLTPERPEVMARLGAMQSAFLAQGHDAVTSQLMALRALDLAVLRQAAVLSFEKVFLITGMLFLAVMPLLLFLKVKRLGAGPPPRIEVHVE
jgi:DHA2 family multidrug resistance protein